RNCWVVGFSPAFAIEQRGQRQYGSVEGTAGRVRWFATRFKIRVGKKQAGELPMTVFTPRNKSEQIKTTAQMKTAKEIKEGEQITGADQIADVLALAADRARRYAQWVPERRVSPSAEAVAALSQFHEKFPDHSTPA